MLNELPPMTFTLLNVFLTAIPTKLPVTVLVKLLGQFVASHPHILVLELPGCPNSISMRLDVL